MFSLQNKYSQLIIHLILLSLYLTAGLTFSRHHIYYTNSDDQYDNIFNGYQMTQGRFILSPSHPLGVQSLYAMAFLLSGRKYDFDKVSIYAPERWYYTQGLTTVKVLNLTLLYLVFVMISRLLSRWGVKPVYRFPIIAIFAANPYLLHHASYALSTIPYAFSLFFLFFTYQTHDTKRYWWLIGIALGLPYCFKFNGIIIIGVFIPILLFEVLRRQLDWRKASLIILIAFLTISPRLIIRHITYGNALYHISMLNMWVEQCTAEAYQDFQKQYGVDIKTRPGYLLARKIYFENHTHIQVFLQGFKGLLVLLLAIFPSNFGGMVSLVLAAIGFILAWRKKVFWPLLIFLLITTSGLAFMVKPSLRTIFRWSQFIPVIIFPFIGLTFKSLDRQYPKAALTLLSVLIASSTLFFYQAYPQIRNATLSVERIPIVVNYGPSTAKWLFNTPESPTPWQFTYSPPAHQTTKEGLSFSATNKFQGLISPAINRSTFWINYLEIILRVDSAKKPVKGKIYFKTNYQSGWSEKRLYRILVSDDGKFHTHHFYIGGYFDFKPNEKIDRLLFIPTVEDEKVKITLKSVRLLF